MDHPSDVALFELEQSKTKNSSATTLLSEIICFFNGRDLRTDCLLETSDLSFSRLLTDICIDVSQPSAMVDFVFEGEWICDCFSATHGVRNAPEGRGVIFNRRRTMILEVHQNGRRQSANHTFSQGS